MLLAALAATCYATPMVGDDYLYPAHWKPYKGWDLMPGFGTHVGERMWVGRLDVVYAGPYGPWEVDNDRPCLMRYSSEPCPADMLMTYTEALARADYYYMFYPDQRPGFAASPEPASFGLLGAGIALIFIRKARRYR